MLNNNRLSSKVKRLEKSGRFFCADTINQCELRISRVTKQNQMAKTFTLPKDLLTQTTALTTVDSCDLLYQVDMVDRLTEELEDVCYAPSNDVVKRVLDYSKAVEVKQPKTMIDDQIIIMN